MKLLRVNDTLSFHANTRVMTVCFGVRHDKLGTVSNAGTVRPCMDLRLPPAHASKTRGPVPVGVEDLSNREIGNQIRSESVIWRVLGGYVLD